MGKVSQLSARLALILEPRHHIEWGATEVSVVQPVPALNLAVEHVVQVHRCTQVLVDVVARQQAHHREAAVLGFCGQICHERVMGWRGAMIGGGVRASD